MVLVNGKDFLVYQLDTKESIISRIASDLDTLPKYLYFPDGIDTSENSDVKAVDILRKIRKNASKSTDFENFLESLDKEKKSLETKEDILFVWLAYNTQLENLAGYSSAILETTADPLVKNNYFTSTNEFIKFWENKRVLLKKEIGIKIEQNKRESQKQSSLYQKFSEIADGMVYTDFKIERTVLRFSLKLSDITLLEIFNYLKLNSNCPFAVCQKYYKILKDFIPPEDWGMVEEKVLLLKVNEKQIVDPEKFKDYTDVVLKIEEGKVNVESKLITEKGYVSQELFLSRFTGVFSKKIKYTDVNETDVMGVFYFPQERLNTYVLSDLVMNNKLFSSLINIDESVKATKKKGENSQPWLHIHFNHPSTGHLTAGITQKVVDRSDPAMKEESLEIFEHGKPYIRVKVKARDRKAVEFFQEMFSKLLVMYNDEYNDIVAFYEQFIPGFGIVEEISIPMKKKTFELEAPEIFVKNYTRNCGVYKMPTIVTDKQAKTHQKEGKEIMLFPRDKPEDEKAKIYDSDGLNQKKYVCLNPEYPYPGLQVNNLDNSEKYPFVPCCFKQEQSSKIGGVYRHYYFGDKLDTADKKQQDCIITDKILGSEKCGFLPAELEKVFEALDFEPGYKYIRLGVNRSQSSFLEAVMTALYDQTGLLDLKGEERENKILETRIELSQSDIAPLARQCAYETPIETVMENISDLSVYLDPKLYIQLLEGFFNCNIYLFSRDRLILPKYTQSYYKEMRRAPSVFIYEHWGSESDHAKYPQCEFLVRWKTSSSEDTQYSFPYEQKISRNIRKIFDSLSESYVLKEKIQPIVFPVNDMKILSQTIDSYGKTRKICVKHSGNIVTMFTDPTAPIATDEKTTPLTIVPLEVASEILGEISSQTVRLNGDKRVLVEVSGKIGNVKVTIPVKGNIIEGVPQTYEMHYPKTRESSLEEFNKNKKYARYMTEYLFWMFSNYVKDNKIEELTDKVLATFARKYIQVIPDFKYGEVSKIFSVENGLMKDGKLVAISEDMVKRLLYVLKLYSIRDNKTLIEYQTRKSITHYYVDITDFDLFPGQVLLQGEDSVDKWIMENRSSFTLQSEIMIGQPTPYFFRNPLVGKTNYLAQNVSSLQRALDIAVGWQKIGYNQGIHVESFAEKKYEFTLYSYVNKDDITEVKVSGKPAQKEIKILGYKLGGTPFYTVLLDLE